MEFCKMKMVVIITEASILDNIIKAITDLGVNGYTVSAVTGKGERGIRGGSGILDSLFKNVKIAIITDESTAKKIMIMVKDDFFENHAGITYAKDVEVDCRERFTSNK